MSVIYNLNNNIPSVYFKQSGQYFRLGIYCYNSSLEEMERHQNVIRLSFDQADVQGAVLIDGKSFEMELNIESWQDVAEFQITTDAELINEFIDQLGTNEKSWFVSYYQQTRQQLAEAL